MLSARVIEIGKLVEGQLAVALRRAEQKYRSIFENATEGIFQTTPDGHYLSANPALARMHGYDSPDELLADRHQPATLRPAQSSH